MKAVILAMLVLIGIDVVHYHSLHLRILGEDIAAAGHEVGSWVWQ